MAENAANFTFTTQNRPSIFEIIAQKSLNDTLQPALEKLALFLSTNFPRKWHWLNKYYDETFLALNILLQHSYLRNYDASFSENFYGLKRVLENDRELTGQHRYISLAFTTILPYLKRKLDGKVNLYRIEDADGCLSNNFEGNYKRFLVRSHSTFHIIWGLVTLHNYLKYMSGESEVQLPILRLLHLKLVYSEPVEDTQNFWKALLTGQLAWNQLGLLRNAVTSTFEVFAFFLQFLTTWSKEKTNFHFTALPTVAAPQFDNKARNYRDKCPICLQFWRIPTVLPVSGYVFCFRCILKHLRDHQCCPVTHLPAKPLDIIRIYD